MSDPQSQELIERLSVENTQLRREREQLRVALRRTPEDALERERLRGELEASELVRDEITRELAVLRADLDALERIRRSPDLELLLKHIRAAALTLAPWNGVCLVDEVSALLEARRG